MAQDTQTLDWIMYRISHDLGSSARAMVELPGWIREDLGDLGVDLPDDVEENLDMLQTNARRLDRMLQDLLEFSRVGRFQSQEKIDFDAIVSRVLKQTPLPDGFKLDVNAPDQDFSSAEPDFSRVVTALLSNAIKHHDGETGHIALTVTIDPQWITVAVTDDGPGIAETDREAATDVLRTLRSRDEVEGSGMGLAIAKRVAALNGGTLEISDALRGSGSLVRARIKRGPVLQLGGLHKQAV